MSAKFTKGSRVTLAGSLILKIDTKYRRYSKGLYVLNSMCDFAVLNLIVVLLGTLLLYFYMYEYLTTIFSEEQREKFNSLSTCSHTGLVK